MAEQGTHKPLVAGSNPAAATFVFNTHRKDQGIEPNRQSYSNTKPDQGIPLKQAVDSFLLSCKVEGKATGTIHCYTNKLKGFLWYAENYKLPNDITAITTQNLREFLVYLGDNEHRWGSHYHRASVPVNSTTIERYHRVLHNFWNWLIREELVEHNPLRKIRAPALPPAPHQHRRKSNRQSTGLSLVGL